MPNVNLTAENEKFAKQFAKKKGMTLAEAVNHYLPRGIKRQIALDKNRKEPTKKAAKKKAPAKKAAKKTRKVAKRTSKKTDKKAASKSNGKAVTVADLKKMKKSGMSNPQIAKKTGWSKDKVYRALKA